MLEEEKNNFRESLLVGQNNWRSYQEEQYPINQEQSYQQQQQQQQSQSYYYQDVDINFEENNNSEFFDRESIEIKILYTLKKSLKFLISQLTISFLKILTSSIILAVYQAPCISNGFEELGERWFLYLMIIYDLIFILLNSIYLKLTLRVLQNQEIDISYISDNQQNFEEQYNESGQSQQQQQLLQQENQQYRNIDTNQNYIDAKYGILRTSKDILEILYLILWIWGQTTIYFYQANCQNNAPGIYYLIIVYIAFGFFSICYPIVILIIACLCFPVIFIFALCVAVKYQKDQDKDEECLICMVPYEQSDEIIRLPCHEKHFFHAECIKKWLIINGICPVCRIRPNAQKK